MSYSIYIGNAELESEWPGDDERPYAAWVVHCIERDDAPYKPDLTGKSNGCHPGYAQWSEAMRDAGLYEMWYDDERGLLRPHPGCRPLTREHMERTETALRALARRHPDDRPGICFCATCAPHDVPPGGAERPAHDPRLSMRLLRLEWMVWWMRWALDNCPRPAVSNS